MAIDTTAISTQGHFGTVNDRLIAIMTQGHFDTFYIDPAYSDFLCKTLADKYPVALVGDRYEAKALLDRFAAEDIGDKHKARELPDKYKVSDSG